MDPSTILGIFFLIIFLLFVYILCFPINQTQFNTIKLRELKEKLEEIYIQNPRPVNIDIPMVYINLDRSADRRQFMENQAKMYNLTLERVPGIDARNLEAKSGKVFLFDREIEYEYHGLNNIKEIACTLSHIKAIMTLYQHQDLDLGIIFEDDVCFATLPFSPVSIEDVINQAPADWEVIKLYTHEDTNIKVDYYDEEKYGLLFSAAAYIINRRGMQHIVDQIKEDKINFGWGRLVADDFIFKYNRTYSYLKHTLVFTYNQDLGSTIRDDSKLVEHCRKSYVKIKDYFDENNQLRTYRST